MFATTDIFGRRHKFWRNPSSTMCARTTAASLFWCSLTKWILGKKDIFLKVDKKCLIWKLFARHFAGLSKRMKGETKNMTKSILLKPEIEKVGRLLTLYSRETNGVDECCYGYQTYNCKCWRISWYICRTRQSDLSCSVVSERYELRKWKESKHSKNY